MHSEWTSWLSRWADAGLIDTETAERIRAFEQTHGGQRGLRWPILIALTFGGLMLGGGVLLFVAAHWEALSPATRFALVLAMVSALHVGGALVGDRFPAMSATLHTVGTIALGGGIAISGQIFHLDEHWPGGVMMWALGAGLAAWILRDTPQIVLLAVLAPLWLGAEWSEAHTPWFAQTAVSVSVLVGGAAALALTYFTAVDSAHRSYPRRALMVTGAVAFPLLAVPLAFAASQLWTNERWPSTTLLAIGLVVAAGVPLVIAYALRRASMWQNAVAIAWIAALIGLGQLNESLVLYAWWALGAVGLVAWGVIDGRTERINMGAILFAATVLTFYFSQVMDKLGRSASLIGLGLLFLGGGWALERVRRRLVVEAREGK